MSSIKVSKKHGLNPMIPVCFWCEKEKNEIVILGRLPGDQEAPMHAVMDYVPCDECMKKFEQGIHIIEVTSKRPEDNRPPLSKSPNGEDVYPTGRYIVAKASAFPNLEVGKPALCDKSVFDRLMELAKADPEVAEPPAETHQSEGTLN